MTDFLKKILAHKILEVKALRKKLEKQSISNESVKNNNTRKKQCTMQAVLNQPGLSIIGEIKHKSPSKDCFTEEKDPTLLVNEYVHGGVDAVSVLTDKEFFSGSIEDLQSVSALLQEKNIPVLQKDFIIDEVQIVEAVNSGADAILLIVTVLGERTSALVTVATQLGIDAVVEIHDHSELDIALRSSAKIIAINNRDLKTFQVDMDIGFNLIKEVPRGIVSIAASGICGLDDIKRIKEAGFDSVLIGEALIKSPDPIFFIRQMKEL